MKRPFISTAWFALLMCIVLGGVAAAAFAIMKPTGDGIDNSQLLMAMKIAGWAIGPVAALLSFIGICVLNALRRVFRLRKIRVLHGFIVLLGIGPWLIFSWVLLDEPRYTQFAIGVMDFAARPLLWGSLTACALTLLFWITTLFPAKK